MIRGFWAFTLCLVIGAESYAQIPVTDCAPETLEVESQDSYISAIASDEARRLLAELDPSAAEYSKLGQYEKALPLYIRSLAIRETIFGPVDPDTARGLDNLATVYFELGRFEESLPLQMRSQAIKENFFGPHHAETTAGLNNLARIYQGLGRYEEALPIRVRSLAITDSVLGSEHQDTAINLNNLASTYKALGHYDQALALGIRSLEIRENFFGPDHRQTAIGLNNLASTYIAVGRYDEALPLRIRAIAIWEKVLGSDHPETAIGLNGLAVTYQALSQYEKALPIHVRALSIFEKVLGPEHPKSATALNTLAGTYSYLGRYEEALPLLIRSLAIREKALGPWHPDTAAGLTHLANTYQTLGQYEKALPLYIRSLAIREKVLGSEHPHTARGLNHLANVYRNLGKYGEALAFQIRALAILEKVLGPDHPDTAVALSTLAWIYHDTGLYDVALPFQVRSLAILERALGPDHPSTAVSLNNLATTYRDLGRYGESLPLQIRALAIMEEAHGPDHPATAKSLGNLAKLQKNLRQVDVAIIFYKLAVNSYQSVRSRVSEIGAAELESYTKTISGNYQDLASLLTEQGRLAEAQQVLDMLKESEQFEFIRRAPEADSRKSKIGSSGAEQVWVTRYRDIADQLGKLVAEQRELEKQAKLGLTPEQKIRQLALKADIKVANAAFTTNLSEISESFAKAGPARKVEVEEISAQTMRDTQSLIKGLGDDVVLVQYYLTENRVNMLVTTPGIQLARHSEMDTKELNRKISELRRLLQDPKSNPLPAAQALYQALVAPIAKDLDDAGARNVMLSLDGTLRYLPFGALHDGKQYLAQRWNLPIYTSVTKNRLRDPVAGQWQAAGLGVTKAWPEFPALAGVKAEMDGIVKTPTGGVMPGEVYLDGGFTAQRLRSVSQRQFPVMHLASHFRFSPGTEVNSFLLLGDGQHLTLGDIRTQNYRFDNVDLLTLSACDTGLGGGRDAQGKEIEGFGVIAQQQGAKAVLATLWPVADQSTASLMADMYRRRQDLQVSKIEALRQAQLALQAQPKYAHPYYWAPFILMGNWK